jgi:hypothetical protein
LAGWAAASQIALPSHLLNLVCRCSVGIAVYAGVLLLLDSRVRSLPSYLLRSRRSQSVEAGIAAEPVLSEAAEEPEEVCK